MCGPKNYQTIDEALDTSRAGTEVRVLEDDADLTQPATDARNLLNMAIDNGDNFLVVRVTPGEDGKVIMDGVTTVADMQMIAGALQRAMLDTLAASR